MLDINDSSHPLDDEAAQRGLLIECDNCGNYDDNDTVDTCTGLAVLCAKCRAEYTLGLDSAWHPVDTRAIMAYGREVIRLSKALDTALAGLDAVDSPVTRGAARAARRLAGMEETSCKG